jgi:tRNA(Ile)-lysidine synthase
VALLHSLFDFGYRKLIVCHFDHQLRGRSSRADACFVEKLTGEFHLDFRLGSANVRALVKKEKMSIETAGREARYSFFAKMAKQSRCRTIFLAHHADDLVETFLLNLFRGTGPAGLAAMHEVSVRRIDDVDLTIVRPWLPVWRAEIDRYVREHRLKFREDASNKNLTPVRNRIRRRVIPDLERLLGRNIRQNIWRTATITADEENWINSQLPDASDVDLAVKKLLELPVAFQRRQILKWLRARNVADIGFEAVERVRSLLEPATRTAKTNLPKNQHVRRRAGKIFIE